MKPRFLLDENLSAKIATGLKRLNPEIIITTIGAEDTLPTGTLDPEILEWIEQHNYILITNNRRSMPAHIAAHFAQGRHFPGILLITQEMSIGEIVAELELIWEASQAEEYFDMVGYIPL